jgi:DNA uptake protein ComE-like DNA-binding protein
LNTATDEQFTTIPNRGRKHAARIQGISAVEDEGQFDKEIGKYVGPKETARLWRFMTIK